MFALINARIYDFSDYMENGYVLFDEKISKTGGMKDFVDKGHRIIDGSGCLVMPSLAVAHTHMYSAFARGMNIPFDPRNFQDILEQLWWKLDAHLDHDGIYLSGLISAGEYACNGVTAIIDHHASGLIRGSLALLKKAVAEAGIRGMFCFETSDRFDADACIYENSADGDMFGLHASMSLSEETLRKVSKAIGGKPIHIHAAESLVDQEHCIRHYGERVVERLARHGLLKKGSILAHCVHVNENEAALMALNGCSAALNAQSNMNNAVGLTDYRMLKNSGVRCLVGNDGMSMGIAGEWVSLLLAMKHSYMSPTAFGLKDLMDVMDNNYNFINDAMNIRIGRIRKDYDADILMIPYDPPTPMNESNAFAHIIHGLAGGFKPRHVWCGGRMIVMDYKNTNVSKEIYIDARKAAGRLWKSINGGEADEQT
ncbi:MAG: amidohydrolase family protein [Clostridia bacterium]|nr:amidohydrolase family protein [Clostridia bacterium]